MDPLISAAQLPAVRRALHAVAVAEHHPESRPPSPAALSSPLERRMSNNELTGEPALWAGFIGGLIQLAAAFWLPWNDEAVAVLNAVVTAAAGVYVAITTRSADNGGSIKAAILGLAQSALTAAMVFGWQVSTEQTSVIMMVLGLGLSLFIRQTSVPAGAPVVRRVGV